LSSLLSGNAGAVDRSVRVVVGLGLLSLTLAGPHSLWGLVGLVPLATALAGSCPLYPLLGTRSCPQAPARRLTVGYAQPIKLRIR